MRREDANFQSQGRFGHQPLDLPRKHNINNCGPKKMGKFSFSE